MRQPSAPLSLYTPEQAEGRDTLATTLISLAKVGGGRAASEVSPLTWRRLPKRCLVASTGSLEKTDRPWSLPGGFVGEASSTRRDRAASADTQPTDSPITMHRVVGPGCSHILRQAGDAASAEVSPPSLLCIQQRHRFSASPPALGLTQAVCSGFQTSIHRNNWIHSSRCPGHSCHVDLFQFALSPGVISPIICKNYL
jgi:hypothetical protein